MNRHQTFDTRLFLKVDPSEWPMMFDALLRPFPEFIGPSMPPMIAWVRAGEPGFPFHHSGGPFPGTINYPKCGEQLALFGEEIA
jgi:hypothetical protein